MAKLKFMADQFKKMGDPVDADSKHVRYVCYANAASIPQTIEDWMETNPREQKMTTNVAKTISSSLQENINFHELNRGILLSAESVGYDNQKKLVTIVLSDPAIHGNIDGGHTLRAILEAQKSGTVSSERYVFMEIFTGLDTPVELAAARNTSVQVDLKSIEELKDSFSVIKRCFSALPFANRIAYKMNEHYNDPSIEPIDVREVITILNMFNQVIYPIRNNDGRLADLQPVQCYTGKEASLKRFLNLGKGRREQIIINMEPIIKDIFDLWDDIESNFPVMASRAGKRYGTRKYTRFNDNNVVGNAIFSQKELQYIVPKGLLYPLVGAFRSLVVVKNNEYSWVKSPKKVWDTLGPQLVTIILDEKVETPDSIAKNSNLWSNLFKEVFIFGHGL
jgi:hypothetical protein